MVWGPDCVSVYLLTIIRNKTSKMYSSVTNNHFVIVLITKFIGFRKSLVQGFVWNLKIPLRKTSEWHPVTGSCSWTNWISWFLLFFEFDTTGDGVETPGTRCLFRDDDQRSGHPVVRWGSHIVENDHDPTCSPYSHFVVRPWTGRWTRTSVREGLRGRK